MSYQEKRAWIYAVIAAVVPVVYGLVLLGRAPAAGLAATPYQEPLLTAVGAAVGLNIVANLFVGGGGTRTDERDKEIGRRGEYIGFYVMSIGAVLPLVLAVREAPYFWIANSLYLCFTLAALVSAVAKIVAYRRGL